MTTPLLPRVRELVDDVPPVDADARAAAMARWAELATPPGSLGQLERLAAHVAGSTGQPLPPVPGAPSLLVCAADHGVHAQGVSPWPQQVTTAMVEAMADGRAACNALARTVGAAVTVLDVGCATPPTPRPGLRSAAVRAGTADLSVGPAMTHEELARAILAGAGVAEELLASGTDLLALGDMGIANTTSSAAVIAALTDSAAGAVVGPGASDDPSTVTRKQEVVARAVARLPDDPDPLDVLAEVGGLEHAALVGAMLAAAAARVPVILDGVITDAAALAAVRLAPDLGAHLIAGHRSTEPGAGVALHALGLRPLLELDLRLGEGTGALLAIPLVQAACRALAEVAPIADVLPGAGG